MNNPWQSEKEIDIHLAQELIEKQFPDANLITIEFLGKGFDNTVFLVNKQYVFRFPRKSIAVKLIETEIKTLPMLQKYISVAIPTPIFVGEPSSLFEWPFAGYNFLQGHSADYFQLAITERKNLATRIAKALKEIHTISLSVGKACDLGPDPLDRFNIAERQPKIIELIGRVKLLNLFDNADLLKKAVDRIDFKNDPQYHTIVHGDFYSKHILLNDQKKLCGVIDWGDLEIGNPGLDLMIMYTFLPPSAWNYFVKENGNISEDIRKASLFRAINHTLHCILYSHNVQDQSFLKEALVALHLIVEHIKYGNVF